MRHGYFGKKLSRTKNERRRLLMVLARQLIAHGQIKTTIGHARAVQPLVEKLITHAKKGRNGSKRRLFEVLAHKDSVQRLLDWAPSRFATRTSGFTRIVRLGARSGDNAQEALFSFVDPIPQLPVSQPSTKTLKSKAKKVAKQSVKETKVSKKPKTKRVKKLSK